MSNTDTTSDTIMLRLDPAWLAGIVQAARHSQAGCSQLMYTPHCTFQGRTLSHCRCRVQNILAYPADVGTGDRAWLPPASASRGDANPRGDARVFFSIALDVFQRMGRDKTRDGASDRFWYERPGAVNLDMLKLSPDSYALQRAFRTSADLALVAVLVEGSHPDAAASYRATALTLLNRPFLGDAPLRPDLEWARALPRYGNLDHADWRNSNDCFVELNGLVGVLDTLQLLPASAAQRARFATWLGCAERAALNVEHPVAPQCADVQQSLVKSRWAKAARS
jgi:hypothetical protein